MTRGSESSRVARGRAGFTLVELVVVLCVLAVIAALTWSPFERYLVEVRLRESVRELRRVVGGARGLAIESGLVYQFRYEPGGRRYMVLPLERPPTETTGGTATVQASSVGKPVPVRKTIRAQAGELDESCRFPVPTSVTPGDTIVERVPQELLGLLEADAVGLNDVQWSPAVRFMPDGTAEDQSLNIANETKLSMNVSVRGLTGVVYVGEVVREP